MTDKKVLHLLTSKSFSGAENVVLQIIEMFRNDEISMVYCSLKGPIEEHVKSKNIKFQGLNRFSYFEIKKVINEFNPDIIHAHDIKASIMASLFAKKSKIISHIHGNHDDMKKITLKAFLYKLRSNKFKHIFWVSKSALNEYKYYENIKMYSSILYNVINIKELEIKKALDAKKYNYDIIYLGRLSYPKNPERLISIFQKVHDKLPSTRFAIVGEGPLKKEVNQMAIEMGISQSIEFLGFKPNPLKILSDSKLMVMTSRYEGTPMCALEAMSLGVPIVSTPTDGLKDIIEHGKSGYLSENDEELVSYICNILLDKNLNNKLREESRLKAKEINNIEIYKKRLKEVYIKI